MSQPWKVFHGTLRNRKNLKSHLLPGTLDLIVKRHSSITYNFHFIFNNRKSSGNDFVEKVGKKKKRKPRLPKVYDPNIPPDPERWLPKHERSNYKKRKDRRYRDTGIGKGTQGAASGSSDQ